jgi:hypothetical protein
LYWQEAKEIQRREGMGNEGHSMCILNLEILENENVTKGKTLKDEIWMKNLNILHQYRYFLLGLGFELGAVHLQSRHSTTLEISA